MPDTPKPSPDLTGFSRAEYTINGVRTVVHSIGSGPALVFLHGTGTFTGFEMARDWAKRHTVIIPYHAGFGDSGDAETIDTVEDHVLHYMDLFDKLGLEQFDLAGFSLGGWLAAEFAIRQPHRVRKLVLVAPAGLVVASAPAPGLFEIAPQELPAYLAHDPAAALRYFPKAPDPAFDARLGREVTGFAKLIRSEPQGNPKLAHWLHRITMPTLVLWGAARSPAPDRPGRGLESRPPRRTRRCWCRRPVISCSRKRRLPHATSPTFSPIDPDITTEDTTMIEMPPGVTPAKEGFGNVVWNILGQTYTLKQHSEASMAWHAVFPDGTFVPPHIHPTQDEFVYVLSGRYDLWLDGKDFVAKAGDLVRMPKGIPHGIFNKSGETATSLFWVAPTRSLKELFERIHNLPDPQEVVRRAAEHEVNFLPPPA